MSREKKEAGILLTVTPTIKARKGFYGWTLLQEKEGKKGPVWQVKGFYGNLESFLKHAAEIKADGESRDGDSLADWIRRYREAHEELRELLRKALG